MNSKSQLLPAQIILKSSCAEKQGKLDEANLAFESLIIDPSVMEARILFLLRYGLEESAKKEIVRGLDKTLSAKSILFLLGQAHAGANFKDFLIDIGLKKFPENLDLLLQSAQYFYQKGNFNKVGALFAHAALLDAKYHYHSAEAYRQAGEFMLSEYQGQMIQSKEDRLKHLTALFVDQSDYVRLLGLEHQILKSELANKDEVSYALAYSHAQIGNYPRMMVTIDRIKSDRTFIKAQKLKAAIELCQKGQGSCRI